MAGSSEVGRPGDRLITQLVSSSFWTKERDKHPGPIMLASAPKVCYLGSISLQWCNPLPSHSACIKSNPIIVFYNK